MALVTPEAVPALQEQWCGAQLQKQLSDATTTAKYLSLPVQSNDVLMIVNVLDFEILPWQ